MPDLRIAVARKTAAAAGQPVIVCGNSDYTVTFTFDSEWDAYTAKTARFAYYQSGQFQYRDVLFEGDSVSVPILREIDEVAVGVYAGNLHTTTPARIPCARCITDGSGIPAPPAPDVYDQLMQYLADLQRGPAAGECTAAIDTARGFAGAVSVNLAGFVDMMQQTWENGSSGSDGTFDGTSSTRIRCQTFIPIPDGTTCIGVVCRGTDSTAWYFEPNLYSSDSESSFVGSSVQSWTYSGTVITPPASSKYIRLVLRNQSSSNITPSNLGMCTIYFY